MAIPDILRMLRASADGAQLRTATFDGREHLVVPVVPLVEGVVHASNAPQAELVEFAELERVPQGWNGRPAVAGHPVVLGQNVSANDPRVLEQYAFGTLFNARAEERRLKVEAWVDTQRADRTAGARDVVRRLRAGETVEVSVGVFITTEARAGVHNGKPYQAVWRDIVPDHLAFLAAGDIGACSVDMGCGAPRTAVAAPGAVSEMRAAHAEEEAVRMTVGQNTAAPSTRSLRERLRDMWRSVTRVAQDDAEDLSDVDLRNALERALRASEPGYLGIDSIFPADNQVVYAVAPEDQVVLWRRSFTVADGAVTLEDDREQVRMVTRFEPVRAAEAAPQPVPTPPPPAATPAPVAEIRTEAASPARADTPSRMAVTEPRAACACAGEGGTAMSKAERIQALIAKGRFTEADRPWLEQVPEDRFAALEADQPAPSPPPTPTPQSTPSPTAMQTPTPAPAPTPASTPSGQPTTPRQTAPETLSAEQYIAQAPPDVQEFLGEGLRAAQAHRAALIVALKATNRCPYTDAELQAMRTADLTRLVQLAAVPEPPRVVDFSLRGARPTDQQPQIPDPPSLIDRVAATKRPA